MWISRLEDSIGDEEIEVAANPCGGKPEALPQDYSC
jgi:hypothetical protein